MSGSATGPFVRSQAVIAFAAIALLVATPLFLAPPVVHDSFWIDYVWAGRFHDALAQGRIYPRWLSASFGGLGAPVFYFYAPLAFYATSIGIFLGLGVYPALIATFACFHALSGVTMYRWLGGRGRAAFVGAALYMLLPYHLLDFYRRGALAEFAAYMLLPLVASFIGRTGSRRGMAGLAMAYAGLVLTHLPTALLASLFLLPPLMLRRPQPRTLVRSVLALLLGLMLSAVYLLPALSLQAEINIGSMWARPEYGPAHWRMVAPIFWSSNGPELVFAAVELSLVPPALLLWRRGSAWWAALALAALLLAANAVPLVWSLSILEKVQFPYRALTIAEFAISTGVARALAVPDRSRALLYGLLPALALGIPIVAAPLTVGNLAMLDADRPEVPEYLPSASPARTSADAEALARRTPDRIERGGWTVRHRFWFPGVVVRCGDRTLRSFAEPGTGLLSYRTPVGCVPSVDTTALPVERWGWILSMIALAATVGLAAAPGRGAPSIPVPAAA